MNYNPQHNIGQMTGKLISEEAKDDFGNCLVCQRSGLAILPLRWTLSAAPFVGNEVTMVAPKFNDGSYLALAAPQFKGDMS